ncbi:metallophosphoesterase [Niveibacterium sp. COAC-50]|uniref:metallophosphoesterase n=1 Tax=Niveibacterium sp. COAC-50 TaxID=2729384 RepID=UPI00155194B8
MRIWLLSDLHLEHGPWFPPVDVAADVLVLAGDIAPGARALHWLLHWREFLPQHIVYVAGNHEGYRHVWCRVIRQLRAAPVPGLSCLENKAAVINGVRFLGCTLWTDFELLWDANAVLAHAGYLNDFRAIETMPGLKLSPQDMLRWHRRSRRWLDQRLSMPHDGPTVVVTHHAPSIRSIAPQYLADPATGFFASNLEHTLLDGRAALWLHGHTHASSDYAVDGTRVVANPAGYPLANGQRENSCFDARLVLEVG